MNELETAIQQLHEGRSVLHTFDQFKKRVLETPREQLNEWDRAAADWFSMTVEEMWNYRLQEHRDRISPEALGKVLGMGRKAVLALPLKHYMPFEQTPSGFRQVTRLRKSDVITFLTSLNPSYADFDFDEPLLKPESVCGLFQKCGANITTRTLGLFRKEGGGPDYIQLNARVHRYRLSDVIDWLQDPEPKPLAASELIMRGFDHDY